MIRLFPRKTHIINSVAFTLLFLAFSYFGKNIYYSGNTLGTQTTSPDLFYVSKVVDGDTIEVTQDNSTSKIRLIGINTPETVDPRKPVECYGKEASAKLKELIQGKYVKLESDTSQSDTDKYGRLLRYVFLENGLNINKLMITEGYAYEYTYDVPYKYQIDFKQVETEARDNKHGLWNPLVCR